MGIHQEKMAQTCRIHTILIAETSLKQLSEDKKKSIHFNLLTDEHDTNRERSSASCLMMLTRLFLGRTGEFWSLIF